MVCKFKFVRFSHNKRKLKTQGADFQGQSTWESVLYTFTVLENEFLKNKNNHLRAAKEDVYKCDFQADDLKTYLYHLQCDHLQPRKKFLLITCARINNKG